MADSPETKSSDLEVKGVSWHYRNHAVLEDAGFSANAGECIGIVGLNGSGKSTLLGILAGIRKARTGSFTCFGHDLFRERDQFTRMVGYMPQENPLISDLSVSDNLRLWSGVRPDPENALIRSLELGPLLKRKAGGLSGGEKRRLTACCALLKGQRVLIMDEPTSALDLNQKAIIHRCIQDHVAGQGIVIMATHDIIEMELCSRLYCLDGCKLTESDVEQVVRHLRKENRQI